MNIQTARKDHICDSCGKKIPQGDKYVRDRTYETRGYDGKEHLNCCDYETDRDKRIW